MYGRPPLVIPKYVLGTSKVEQVDRELHGIDKMLKLLKDNLIAAQARMKQQYDQHKGEREFSVGDWVFLRLQPYKQTSIQTRASMKFSPWFYGPYQILERIKAVAYKLDLSASSQIYLVFHVSCLKLKQG